MDNKDEIIEEISDIEEIKDEVPVEKVEEINDKKDTSNEGFEGLDLNIENIPKNENIKPKSKAPVIILLSVLLFLDLAVLVMYMIGFDKVLSIFM